MYKATIRALLRKGMADFNEGRPDLLLKLAHPNATIAFPGENSLASMFRPVEAGRERHDTHRGIEECRAFVDRCIDRKLQFVVEDVLVNGPPWNTRVAARVHNFIAGPDGDSYTNRFVAFLVIRWGRLVSWEDFEDTQRVARWEQMNGDFAAYPQVCGRIGPVMLSFRGLTPPCHSHGVQPGQQGRVPRPGGDTTVGASGSICPTRNVQALPW